MDFEQRSGKEVETTIIDGMPASILTGTDRTPARALLACYLDMTPEQQRLARAYIQDKALPEVQALRNAAGTPGGALAADLLQNLQHPCNRE